MISSYGWKLCFQINGRNNGGDGIRMSPLTTAIFGGAANINNNLGWGLNCIGTHSVTSIGNVLAAGNGNGEIAPNCGF